MIKTISNHDLEEILMLDQYSEEVVTEFYMYELDEEGWE